MPLKWERGKNPYTHNYFGRLGIGPNVSPGQIIARAKQLKQQMDSREEVVSAGERLDDHAVSEASQKLREPQTRAHELLLVHPQPQGEGKKLKKLCDDLRHAASLPEVRPPLPLLHPFALFWFAPAPGSEAAELPDWSAFGLVDPGSEPDRALDIVFDS